MAYKDKFDERARKSRREWYERNKEQQIARQMERKRENYAWLKTLKTKCARCPESDPACLVFHHTKDKVINVTEAVSKGWGRERILQEIEKCIVLCANCHAKEHISATVMVTNGPPKPY